MEIKNYRIQTSMGGLDVTSRNMLSAFLSEEQIDNFNSIGYSGKTLNGEEISRAEYLNSQFSEREKFEISQISYDRGDFRESFILTRVIVSPKPEPVEPPVNL